MHTKATFLGRVIGYGEVKPNPEMYATLEKWEAPKTKKHQQSFLGFVNYYREFVQGLSEISYPLKELTKPNREFKWGDEHQECFEKVKSALLQAPLLHQPDEEGEFTLDTDASEVAIAGILSQKKTINGEVKECPIAFGSKARSETEMRYAAAKAEILAAIYFVEKYQPYLTRGKFTFKLRTDNRALSWLKRYSMTRGMAARWIQRLDQYHFDVEHRPREKDQNGVSKKTEFYDKKQIRDENLPEHMPNFKFLADPTLFDKLPELIDSVEMDQVCKHSLRVGAGETGGW